MTLAVRVAIEGRVQNVWFRAWTCAQATARGLRGWVRNRADGTVEALFVGPPEAVRAMIEACREGPSAAQVARVVEHPATDDGAAGFEQRPSA